MPEAGPYQMSVTDLVAASNVLDVEVAHRVAAATSPLRRPERQLEFVVVAGELVEEEVECTIFASTLEQLKERLGAELGLSGISFTMYVEDFDEWCSPMDMDEFQDISCVQITAGTRVEADIQPAQLALTKSVRSELLAAVRLAPGVAGGGDG